MRLLGLPRDERAAARGRQGGGAIPALAAFWPIYEADWLKLEHAPGTQVKIRSAWKRHLEPWGGQLRLDLIGAAEVTQLKKAMRDSPVQFNRCRSYLSHMLGQARIWGHLPRGWPNACQDVPRYEEAGREREISPEELARVGRAMKACEDLARIPKHERPAAAEAISPVAAAAIRALMATGARPVELLGLKRSELEAAIAAGRIVRPSLKAGKKRRRRRPVYLNQVANRVLLNAPRKMGNPHVFPGRLNGGHLTIYGLDAAWERVRRAAGLEDVRLYDVSRHAFGTMAALLATNPQAVQDLLGHSDFRTTQRYIHRPAGPLQALSESTAAALDRALAGPAEVEEEFNPS